MVQPVVTYSVNIFPLHIKGNLDVSLDTQREKQKDCSKSLGIWNFQTCVYFFKKCCDFPGTVSDRVPACHGTYNHGVSVSGRVGACPQNNIVTPPDLGMFWWKYGFKLISFTTCMQHMARSLYKLKLAARWKPWITSAKVKVNGPTGTQRVGPREKC